MPLLLGALLLQLRACFLSSQASKHQDLQISDGTCLTPLSCRANTDARKLLAKRWYPALCWAVVILSILGVFWTPHASAKPVQDRQVCHSKQGHACACMHCLCPMS